VQNVLSTVTVIQLDCAGDSGTVVREISDPRFDVPTTAARFGGHAPCLPYETWLWRALRSRR
jgi:hypothetical protein